MDEPIPFQAASPQEAEAHALRMELRTLKQEHRDLDDSVRALQDSGLGDALTLQRLKRRKLALKDRIAALEDRIFPDIIA